MTKFQSELTDEKKSPFKKYREIFVGKKGFWDLLKFEIITTFISSLPGGIGFFLRKISYPFIFGKIGKNVVFGRSITFRHPHKIIIGDNVIIDDNCVLDGKSTENPGIVISNNVFINRNTILSCHFGTIEIGDNTNIGNNSIIHSASKVKIGKNVIMAASCHIIGSKREMDRLDVPVIAQQTSSKGIYIEDNVWLGALVFVNDGVTIGRDSVIGAGSIVLNDIPEYHVAFGSPAKPVRTRKEKGN
ncbi:MAG: acyltransferase [Acidobacteriota bacterium]